MPVYVIAQLTIHDPARYDAYAAQFMPTLTGYRARLLAADEAVTVAEGEWPHDKVVVLEFDDEAEFRRWSTSDAYEHIAVDRRAATSGAVLVVHGPPNG